MVRLSQYLKSPIQTENSQLPLLNSLFSDNFGLFAAADSPEQPFKQYMAFARRSPQVMGFLQIIVSDMLSDEIEWTPVEKNASGRNRVLRSKEFFSMNSGLDVTEAMFYDLLINGVGYEWIGKLSDVQQKEFKEVCVRMAKAQFGFESKEFLEYKAEELFTEYTNGRKGSIAKKLRHIAASTMSIRHDEYETYGYVQNVGMKIKTYSPDEIIQFNLIPFDGKPYPLPPMESILAEVYLLWLVTQNSVSYFENGGHPDKVFILPKEIAGSPNHRYLIETLKKYKKIQNKHGNMVFTGELAIEDLVEAEAQMEHKELGLYLVSVLAMYYGLPIARIPFLVGKAASGGDSGGLADSGYWRKISVWQSKIEEPMNRQLWRPYFGTEMKFRRGYLQDEVRETQNEIARNDIVEQRLALGLITIEAAADFLDIDQEELEEAQRQKQERDEAQADLDMKSGMLRQNQQSKSNSLSEPDKKLKNRTKQSTMLQRKTQGGGKVINP